MLHMLETSKTYVLKIVNSKKVREAFVIGGAGKFLGETHHLFLDPFQFDIVIILSTVYFCISLKFFQREWHTQLEFSSKSEADL